VRWGEAKEKRVVKEKYERSGGMRKGQAEGRGSLAGLE